MHLVPVLSKGSERSPGVRRFVVADDSLPLAVDLLDERLPVLGGPFHHDGGLRIIGVGWVACSARPRDRRRQGGGGGRSAAARRLGGPVGSVVLRVARPRVQAFLRASQVDAFSAGEAPLGRTLTFYYMYPLALG